MPDTPLHTSDSTPDPVASGPDLTGKQLGDFRLLRRLGRGGMAVVYLAEQGSLSRQVAMKVLKSELSTDDKYVRRFHHEAKAAASLVHANIVQIHEVGEADGIHYIAQEYVSGKNLRQVLTRTGPFDAGLAVNVMRQVAAALHKAAQQGIIHRDIKPENIMLSAAGEVKVADFGLARVTQSNSDVELTQVGVTMGTPLYMSPEQIEAKDVDPRSDLYSFGITCYQMLSGRTPFEGETALSIAVQHLKTDADRLEDLRPDLPSSLCRVIHRLIAKRPDDRFQSASDLLKELRSLQIEGLEDGWPTDLSDWSAPELLAISNSQFEATQRLDNLMKTQAMQQVKRKGLGTILLAAALCLIVGAMLGMATRPKSLLAVSDSAALAIPRKQSVQDQYIYAMETNTEDAWKSIGLYFDPNADPQNAYHFALGNRHLADFYLDQLRFEDAIDLYQQVIDSDAAGYPLRVIGLIGQANAYGRSQENSKALQKISAAVGMIVDKKMKRNDWQSAEDSADHGFVQNEFRRLYRERVSG